MNDEPVRLVSQETNRELGRRVVFQEEIVTVL